MAKSALLRLLIKPNKTLFACSLLLVPQQTVFALSDRWSSTSSFRPFSYRPQRRSCSMAILDSPSAQRNKEPIWNVLSSKVIHPLQQKQEPKTRVLEIAAGCGVHTEYFVKQLQHQDRNLEWYPTDPDEPSRASIRERTTNLSDAQPPMSLTLHDGGIVESATDDALVNDGFDLILCINMIHISPWSATLGLMLVASQKLKRGGVLYCYGPYMVEGSAVESNLRFLQSLQRRNPEWGVRNLEDVTRVANQHGLVLKETVEMPANNLSVIFQKQ